MYSESCSSKCQSPTHNLSVTLAPCQKGKCLTKTQGSLLTRIPPTSPASLPHLCASSALNCFEFPKSYFNQLQTLTILPTPSRKLSSPLPPNALHALLPNSFSQPPQGVFLASLALSGFPYHIVLCSLEQGPHRLLPDSACRLFALCGQGPGVPAHHCIPSKWHRAWCKPGSRGIFAR